MGIEVSENIIVICNSCGKRHIVSPDDLEWECLKTSDRKKGAENSFEAEILIFCECGKKIQGKINAREYPKGVFNGDEYNIEGGTIEQKCNIAFNSD